MKEKLIKIFSVFFKIGAFSFGGGYAMVLIIQREVVDKHKWLTIEEFIPMLALAQSAPGPMVVNTAIITGYRLNRKRGAMVAALGSILPAFIIMLAIALLFLKIADNAIVQSAFMAIRPAVAALILTPVIVFAQKTKKWTYPVSLAVAVAIYYGISPLLIILFGAVAGVGYAYYNGKKLLQ